MLEIPILKEIRAYETKLIGPLSFRGLICVSASVAGAYAAYALQMYVLGMDTPLGWLCFVAAVPGAAFWVIKPYGLKLEVYLKSAFVDTFVAPKRRVYQQELTYASLTKDFLGEEEVSCERKGRKKVPKKQLPEELRRYK